MSIKNWILNRQYGGISDDRFLGLPYSHQYSEKIEFRKNPNSITLAYKVEKDSSTTVDSLCLCSATIKSTGDLIVFGSNGKIWRKAYGRTTYVLVYTDTSARKIINAIEYNDYLYWFTQSKVHRIAISAIDDAWSGSVTENYKTFTVGNANAHPAIELFNKLYIGDSYYLAELDNFGIFTGNKIEIFHDEEIRNITYSENYLRMYSRRTNKIDFGAAYLWSGTTTNYEQRMNYEGHLIHSVFNFNGSDYIVADRQPKLYTPNGYTLTALKRIPFVYDIQQLDMNPNAMTVYDGLLCFGLRGSYVSTTNATIKTGIMTYGRENDLYNDSLGFEYLTSNENNTDIIGFVTQSAGDLYFSWSNSAGTTFGIDKVNKAKYATSGYLESLVSYGDSATLKKALMNIKSAFCKLADGEKIQIFLKGDLTANYPSTPEIVMDYANTDDRGIVSKEKDADISIGDFNYLETKIVLTSGTSNATTPEVTETLITFEDGIETSDVND